MSCEVCGVDTSESDGSPTDTVYYMAVFKDDEVPEGATPDTRYEFCSLDHLRMFTEVPEQ